jgi:hypothetical protein
MGLMILSNVPLTGLTQITRLVQIIRHSFMFIPICTLADVVVDNKAPKSVIGKTMALKSTKGVCINQLGTHVI